MTDETTLYQRLGSAIERFESSTNPKEKYRAESAACRISQQLGYRGVVYGKEGVYIPQLEPTSQVPRLNKVLELSDLDRFAVERNSQATDFMLLRPSFISGLNLDEVSLYEGRARGVRSE